MEFGMSHRIKPVKEIWHNLASPLHGVFEFSRSGGT